MSVWRDIHERSTGGRVRKEDYIHITDDYANLPDNEKCEIKTCLESTYDDLRDPDMLSINNNVFYGNLVELSDDVKTYLTLFKDRKLLPEKKEDWDKEVVEELDAIRVLGEYKDGTIILYINNIKDAAYEENAPEFNGNSYLTVTRYVYLHERMHAFFESEWHERMKDEKYEYNYEKEEELAEFGALLLLDQLVNPPQKRRNPGVNLASKEELEWAVRHVERKKGALECYSRGAYLFKLFGPDKTISKDMLEAYIPSRLYK